MKLADLHPVLESKRVLVIDCPCGAGHRLPLPIGKDLNEWQMTGTLDNLTLTPSIETSCSTFLIRNGRVVTA